MTTIEAGDVVVVLFIGARETKRRPTIVLSSLSYNDQKSDLILAMVTSNIELASTPFDVVLFDWEQANLKGPSAVRMFIGMSEVRDTRKIGRLSDADWREVQTRLKRALEV